MDYLTLSVAYTGLKAVSAVVSNFSKLKKLSDLPAEVKDDTFYLIHTVTSIKPALELAILLQSRQITAIHVSSAISLARKVLVECETFIESISFIDDDDDSDHDSEDDYDDNTNDVSSASDSNCAITDDEKLKNKQEIISYLSAPAQRDKLALLLRRLALVLQALNLGITASSFIFPKHITIYQFPFQFEYQSFQIALDLVRKMEMNRKFNTPNKREIWVLTGHLHTLMIPSSRSQPILTRLCHTKAVLSLEQKKRKLDGQIVYAGFMTLSDIEQNTDNECKNKCYKMELDFLEFEKFKRFDPVYTKNLKHLDKMVLYDEDDIRNIALCYQWTYKGQRFILEFEPLDSFNLQNISHPISCEVFEFLIALLVIRSTYLESNSKTKHVLNNPSVLDQFVSTREMIQLSKKYLRLNVNQDRVTPEHKMGQAHDGNTMDDLVQTLNQQLSVK
eukprot:455806_1